MMATQNGTGAETSKKPRAVRGKWTFEQQQEIVAASLVAGASVNEVAERYGVRAGLVSSWRRRHAAATKAKKTSRFAAVQVSRPISSDGVIEIDLLSQCVRVRGIVDARILREVLAAIR
jgi:transposase-like protein